MLDHVWLLSSSINLERVPFRKLQHLFPKALDRPRGRVSHIYVLAEDKIMARIKNFNPVIELGRTPRVTESRDILLAA
jgi:hypothetical protein